MPAFYNYFTIANSLAASGEGHPGRGVSVKPLLPLPPEQPFEVEISTFKLGLQFMVLYISTANFDEPSGYIYLLVFQA